jgi:hypothetical protein
MTEVDISIPVVTKEIDKLMNCEIIKESEVKALCNKYKEILSTAKNVQFINSPVTVLNAYNLF